MAHLTAVPQQAPEQQSDRHELGVIEGGLNVAARVMRALGTTLLATFIIGLVGALVLHATIIEDQRDLDSQRAAITRVARDTEAMRSELAELEAPSRIVEDALDLGMIEPASIEYLTVPGGQVDDYLLTMATNQLLVNE